LTAAYSPALLFAEPITLPQALENTPQYSRLAITLADSQQIQGQFIRVTPDSITLQTGDSVSSQHIYSLNRLLKVQRWRSDIGRSARNGAIGGALVLGGFGLMAGLSLNDTYDEDSNGIAIFVTGLGVGLGALSGAILGLGTGALSRSWHDLWPVATAPPRSHPDPYSQKSRLSLMAGVGHSWLENYKVNRFAGRIALLNKAGEVVRFGPELSFVDFGDTRSVDDGKGTLQTNKVQPLFRAAVSLEASQSGAGTLPFLNLGLGVTASNNLILSGHLGGGLRNRRPGGTEFDVDLRFHFNFTDVPSGEVDSFFTIGFGFGFGL
jgi:hypothetical protein